MTRIMLSLLMVMLFVSPAMAQQSLTPIEVEALPFDGNALTNITPITQDIDMGAQGEHIANTKKKAGLPQFDTSTFSSQIFWLVITFIILYFYFAKNALPKLSSAIENRRATIRTDLEQADLLSNDIDKTRNDYELAMQDAHNNARQTVTDMQDTLRREADAQSSAFKAKTDETIANFEAKAEKAKAEIKSDLNDVAASLTQDIVHKISGLSVNDSDINAAILKFSGASSVTSKSKKAA